MKARFSYSAGEMVRIKVGAFQNFTGRIEEVDQDKATLAPLLEASPSLAEKLETIILERRRETADRLETAPGADPLLEPATLRTRIRRFFGLAS